MKKIVFLMMGCMLSLSIMADTQIHNMTLESDPYTCQSINPLTLQSTLSSTPGRVQIYEQILMEGEVVYQNDLYTGTGSSSKTYTLNPTVGKRRYVVEAWHSGQVMPGSLPSGPDREDIYNVDIQYHVENHDITLYSDILTHQAEFQFFTTAGTVDPQTGNTFCGMDLALYYKRNAGISEDITNPAIITADPDIFNEIVPLGEGIFTYSAYLIDRYKNIVWCDRFNITVKAPVCQSGLVYRKWDDFMFVDNGDGGGDGSFISYQWYKEGQKIDGATQQWIRTTLPKYEKAAPSGRYYVYITDENGNLIVTCPSFFEDLPASAKANMHEADDAPARKQIINGQLRVEFNGKWYNAQGQVVK